MNTDPKSFARFNRWANGRLHAACATLTPEALSLKRNAFFGSIMGTLNHILLVDILYRERLEGRKSRFKELDETLHRDLHTLSQEQSQLDNYYVELLGNMTQETLSEKLRFNTLLDDAQSWEVDKDIYFANLFQHQIHHRGQAHNMLSQAGIAPPPIGFIEYHVELGNVTEATPK
ncbi:MAG: damage-inducible protein DinB [Gammaproteobacteria bacterium]|nr:damage-inducible protein DinB [Gammaproteobacteria bacterium]